MGQILHGSATTTHAVRAAIQRSKASLQALSARYVINPKTVEKWRKRTSLEDRPMGPQAPHSAVLSAHEETLIVAFRRHTLLPLRRLSEWRWKVFAGRDHAGRPIELGNTRISPLDEGRATETLSCRTP